MDTESRYMNAPAAGKGASTAAYKPLPQAPPSQALLADETDDLDALDLQNRHLRQNLAHRSQSPLPSPYADDPKNVDTNIDALEMAAYEPESDFMGIRTGREPELVGGSDPVKEERKGDRTALYVTLVSRAASFTTQVKNEDRES